MWKPLNFWEKCFFTANLLFGFVLLFCYVLPYIPPKNFPLSSLSIFTPILIIINILFIFLWIFKRKRNIIFSIILFLLGLPFFNRFIHFSSTEKSSISDISLMTFNVRVFNHYNWHKDKNLHQKIINFIKEKHPKIVALQEFHRKEQKSFDFYKYQKVIYKNQKDYIGQAILSDYPIINSGSLNFPNTGNNGVFADIIIEKDTIRLYSLHFESFHINPEEQELLSHEGSKKFFLNIGRRFATQQSQVEIFDNHRNRCPYKIFVCGDFNNTAFSYLYRKIKSNNLIDSFEASDRGFGRTFSFKYFPFRIDYILVDKSFSVTSYHTFQNTNYSDHYPILATIRK